MLERLLPAFAAWAETREDLLGEELFAAEREVLGRAVDKRRREFITARSCARTALRRLGEPAVAIGSGKQGEPLWPAGIVGSITHCEGYRAAAVAHADDAAGLGIDAEPNAPLPDGVLEQVAYGRERELVSEGAGLVDVGRLLFSAKEAVYKAWFPLERRQIGFDDVELWLDLERSEFTARTVVAGPLVGGRRLSELRGAWAVEQGVICTAVVLRSERSTDPLEGWS